MKAEIITIGDEILIGQIVDTNSAWISARLNEAGVTVVRKLTVGDEKQEIRNSIDNALSECDIVIVTGGLGPTKDDITKLTLAEYFGCGLVRDDKTHEMNRRVLEARGVDFNELNRNQSLVPECCKVLLNHNGTAPGMWFERDGKVLVSLPGVPFEMEELMTGSVIPKLKEHFKLNTIIHKTAITFGMAESVLAETIADWETALPSWLHLAYLPSPSQIRLRLSAYDVSGVDESAEIDRRFAELETIIPAYILGYDNDTVASVVAKTLSDRHLTLSAAESCTGGAVSSRFTAIQGASEYFMGSIVSYSNEAKINTLGVSAETLATHSAVSREVAEQMAAGARRVFGTDYSIATTGIAGPDGGTAETPVGTVWIAVATPEGVVSRKLTLGKLRTQNIERATATAINLLRLILIGNESAKAIPGTL